MDNDLFKKIIFFYLFATSCLSMAYFGMKSTGDHLISPLWKMISFLAHSAWAIGAFAILCPVLAVVVPFIGKLLSEIVFYHRRRRELLEDLKQKRREKNETRRRKREEEQSEKEFEQQEEERFEKMKQKRIRLEKELIQKQRARDTSQVSKDALEDFL